MTQDDVLLETAQFVRGACKGGLGENLGGLLEACARQEALALQRSLGDAEQQRLVRGWLWLLGLRFLAALVLGERVGFLDVFLGEQTSNEERGVARVLDAQHAAEVLVALLEVEAFDDLVRQEVAVTRGGDAHLAQHLSQDGFDVLVGDHHALRAIDILHLVQHVAVQGFFALDAQDVSRNLWTFGERIARHHAVARVDAQVLALRNVMVELFARVRDDADGHLALALVTQKFHASADFGKHSGVLRITSFEEFSDARQTTDDVSAASSFLRLASNQLTGGDHGTFFDFDTSLGRQVMEVQDRA